MKNLLLTVLGTALIASCSATKNAKTSQNNRAEFLKMKGDWKITSVEYDKNYKVKPFDEGADINCWIGSQWKLVPNNYTGSYSMTGDGACPTLSQPIKFEVMDGNKFQFKKIADGTKAKQNTSGYMMNILNQSENSFSLQQIVPSGGRDIQMVYNFERVSN